MLEQIQAAVIYRMITYLVYAEWIILVRIYKKWIISTPTDWLPRYSGF